ncbi:hypothetical protein JF290_07320 [Sedimentitalea sp. CAU 1593]|jgi:hypothetical protein|uniref:DUF6455 domain-containing protein n=2 Tax=Sedimentitalea arenosa TaxID=2798803 RepID=A0A8J7LRW6_9RHOB|nr:hypothetical protein [Arenibacterium arenosum]
MSVTCSEIERHFWLTRSVARVMGVCLSKAMAQGRLSPDEYCEMVTRCRSGSCRESCQLWLASRTELAEEPPEECLHRDVLKRLRQA